MTYNIVCPSCGQPYTDQDTTRVSCTVCGYDNSEQEKFITSLTISSSNASQGSVSPSGAISKGNIDELDITATPSGEHTLVSWLVNGARIDKKTGSNVLHMSLSPFIPSYTVQAIFV
jgi:DNA-directed RNA polymerase subunit M/transcription elongation factor TFIIS